MGESNPIDIAVPSNNPNALRRYLLSETSAAELARLGALCVTAQFSAEDAISLDAVANQVGLRVRWTFEPQEELPSMCRLRRLACSLTETQAILHLDDNIELLSGAAEFFKETLGMLPEHNFGACLFGGAMGAGAHGNVLRSYAGDWPSMSRGIITTIPEPFKLVQDRLVGGAEEFVLCANVRAAGKFIARRFLTPTKHHGVVGRYVVDGSDSMIHRLDIAEMNCLAEAASIMRCEDYRKIRFGRGGPKLLKPSDNPVWKESYKNRKPKGAIEANGKLYRAIGSALKDNGIMLYRLQIDRIREEIHKNGIAVVNGITFKFTSK